MISLLPKNTASTRQKEYLGSRPRMRQKLTLLETFQCRFFLSFSGLTPDHCVNLSRQTPALVSCKAKAAFKFGSGGGAIVAMNNDTISTIDSPGKLRRLLDEERMKYLVI